MPTVTQNRIAEMKRLFGAEENIPVGLKNPHTVTRTPLLGKKWGLGRALGYWGVGGKGRGAGSLLSEEEELTCTKQQENLLTVMREGNLLYSMSTDVNANHI